MFTINLMLGFETHFTYGFTQYFVLYRTVLYDVSDSLDGIMMYIFLCLFKNLTKYYKDTENCREKYKSSI